MNKSLLVFTSVFALLLAAAGASAQQYRWTDQKGRVQYGDVPPAGANATPLRGPAGPSSQPEAQKDQSPGDAEAQFRKRQQEASEAREKQAKAEQEAQQKKENCARAQGSLRQLESGQRIGAIDAKGERYYLDEAQVVQETAKARQAVGDWCG
jgi:hypothetical protein